MTVYYVIIAQKNVWNVIIYVAFERMRLYNLHVYINNEMVIRTFEIGPPYSTSHNFHNAANINQNFISCFNYTVGVFNEQSC